MLFYDWWYVNTASGVKTSYILSKKAAHEAGITRAVHQGAKDYGLKNIAKSQFKTAVTSDFAKGHTKASAKINHRFNEK